MIVMEPLLRYLEDAEDNCSESKSMSLLEPQPSGRGLFVRVGGRPQEGGPQATGIPVGDDVEGDGRIRDSRLSHRIVMQQNLSPVLIRPVQAGVINARNESEKDAQMRRIVTVRGVGNENELETVSGM